MRVCSPDVALIALFLSLTMLSFDVGYRTWPAVWEVGANWPNGGEIDIVEGVNNVVPNQSTLHTSSGTSYLLLNLGPHAFGFMARTNVLTASTIWTHRLHHAERRTRDVGVRVLDSSSERV